MQIFSMRAFIKMLIPAVILSGQAEAGPVLPVTINFDDITETADTIIPNGYGGFDWSDFLSYINTTGFDGFNNGIVSSEHAAYGGYSGSFDGTTPSVPGVITSDTPFDFSSAYIGSGYYDGLTVTVQGYFNGSLVNSQSVTVNATSQAQQFSFGFQNVDELKFISSVSISTTDPLNCGSLNCTHFTVDNMQFAAPTIVPVPAAIWMMGSGLLGMVVSMKRRG